MLVLNKAIASVLKELRKARNISQEELASAINSHQVYISEIENGKKQPSVTVLYNIAEFYNISLTEFFTEVESRIKKIHTLSTVSNSGYINVAESPSNKYR